MLAHLNRALLFVMPLGFYIFTETPNTHKTNAKFVAGFHFERKSLNLCQIQPAVVYQTAGYFIRKCVILVDPTRQSRKMDT